MTETFKSDISQKEFPIEERISGKSIRNSVLKVIQQENPDFTSENSMSISELNYYRRKYISDSVGKQIGDITDMEKQVLNSLSDHSILTDKIDDGEDGGTPTLGQKVADQVASLGGSWTFIISFLIFILLWIGINVFWLINKGFDPYPFILLNLLLSCLAALQAPVIMMSQNRQGDKDRDRAKKDYMVNLKSELEIRGLHEKIDHLILKQQRDLMEVQNVQIEMLNEILDYTQKETK